MEKIKIAMDMDGVLYDYILPYSSFYNSNVGDYDPIRKKKYEFNDFSTLNLSRLFEISQKMVLKSIYDFQRTEEFKNLEVIDGAKEFVEKLKEDYNLIVITSRDVHFKDISENQLEKDFPGVFLDVLFSKSVLSSQEFLFRRSLYKSIGYDESNLSRKLEEDQNLETKLGLCKSRGIKYMMEDNIGYMWQFNNSDITGLLFHNPWNDKSMLPEGIIRIGEKGNHWEEVYSYVKENSINLVS